MTLERVFTVAGKEFSDHLMSRRFLIILALFLIITAIGLYQGVEQYTERLESYADQMAAMEQYDGPVGWMTEKPSVMTVFTYMSYQTTMLGAILAVAMGFDLVTREKETRSLKTLLSHPVYRDEIINGKALGGVAALGVAVGGTILLSIAILLIFSIVPNLEELGGILLYGGVTLVFLLAFFSIALLMSTVTRESGNALIYTLIVFFVLTSLLPTFGAVAAQAFAGEPPEPPEMMNYGVHTSIVAVDGPDVNPAESSFVSEEWMRYEEEMQAYSDRLRSVYDVITLISPQSNYQTVVMSITDPSMAMVISSSSYGAMSMPPESPDLGEILGNIWKNIVALFALPAVFFGAAYAAFMRMDVR